MGQLHRLYFIFYVVLFAFCHLSCSLRFSQIYYFSLQVKCQLNWYNINALHCPLHGLIVQHLEGVVFKGMQFADRDLMNLLGLAVFLGRKDVIVAGQADVCAAFRHCTPPHSY